LQQPPLAPAGACSGADSCRKGQEHAAPARGVRAHRHACSSEAGGTQAGQTPLNIGGMPPNGQVLAAREPGLPLRTARHRRAERRQEPKTAAVRTPARRAPR